MIIKSNIYDLRYSNTTKCMKFSHHSHNVYAYIFRMLDELMRKLFATEPIQGTNLIHNNLHIM